MMASRRELNALLSLVLAIIVCVCMVKSNAMASEVAVEESSTSSSTSLARLLAAFQHEEELALALESQQAQEQTTELVTPQYTDGLLLLSELQSLARSSAFSSESASQPSDAAGFYTLLNFGLTSVQRHLSRPNSDLTQIINTLFSKQNPQGLPIAGGQTLQSVTLDDGTLRFGQPVLSGFSVSDDESGLLRITIADLRLRLNNLRIKMVFKNKGLIQLLGTKYVLLEYAELRGKFHITLDSTRLPLVTVSPQLKRGEYSFMVSNIDLQGKSKLGTSILSGMEKLAGVFSYNYQKLFQDAVMQQLQTPLPKTTFDLKTMNVV